MALTVSRKLTCFVSSLADQLFARLLPPITMEGLDSPLNSPPSAPPRAPPKAPPKALTTAPPPQTSQAKTVRFAIASPSPVKLPSDPRLQIEKQQSPPEDDRDKYHKWKGVQTKPPRPYTRHAGRQLNQQIIPSGVTQGRIGKKFPKRSRPKTKGMRNRGVDCYKTSLLQTLLHVPAMYHYLGDIHHHCTLPLHQCVVCSLQHLAQGYWNDETLPETSQQDQKPPSGPTDLLHRLLEACKTNVSGRHAELQMYFQEDTQSDPKLLLDFLLDEIRQQSPGTFFDVFELGEKLSWECAVCHQGHRIRESQEERLDNVISLYLGEPSTNKTLQDKGLTLVSLLSEHMVSSKITIRCNSNKCEKRYKAASRVKQYELTQALSNKLWSGNLAREEFEIQRDRIKTLTFGQLGIEGDENTRKRMITKAPELLVIQLNRLYHGPGWQELKNTTDVHYEEFLDLTTYTEEQEPLVYRLDGVVAHRNHDGGNGGHYTVALRETEGVRSFCNVNDDHDLLRARGGDFAEMQRPYTGTPPDRNRADPTVLIYSKMCGGV